MKRAQAIAPITSLQPPYSMFRRDVEESILPFALKNCIGVIVYSPMFSGLLSGAMTRERSRRCPLTIGAAGTQNSRSRIFHEISLWGIAQENREDAWPHRRRSGDRLDVAQSRGHGSDCRRSHTRAGAGNYRRRRFSVVSRRGCRGRGRPQREKSQRRELARPQKRLFSFSA